MSSKEKGICAHPAPPRRRLAPRGSPPPRCSSGTRQAPRFWGAVTIGKRRGGAASALPPSLERSKKWFLHGPNFQKWSAHGPEISTGPLVSSPSPRSATTGLVLRPWGGRRGHDGLGGAVVVQTDPSREKGRSRCLIPQWPASNTLVLVLDHGEFIFSGR